MVSWFNVPFKVWISWFIYSIGLVVIVYFCLFLSCFKAYSKKPQLFLYQAHSKKGQPSENILFMKIAILFLDYIPYRTYLYPIEKAIFYIKYPYIWYCL